MPPNNPEQPDQTPETQEASQDGTPQPASNAQNTENPPPQASQPQEPNEDPVPEAESPKKETQQTNTAKKEEPPPQASSSATEGETAPKPVPKPKETTPQTPEQIRAGYESVRDVWQPIQTALDEDLPLDIGQVRAKFFGTEVQARLTQEQIQHVERMMRRATQYPADAQALVAEHQDDPKAFFESIFQHIDQIYEEGKPIRTLNQARFHLRYPAAVSAKAGAVVFELHHKDFERIGGSSSAFMSPQYGKINEKYPRMKSFVCIPKPKKGAKKKTGKFSQEKLLSHELQHAKNMMAFPEYEPEIEEINSIDPYPHLRMELKEELISWGKHQSLSPRKTAQRFNLSYNSSWISIALARYSHDKKNLQYVKEQEEQFHQDFKHYVQVMDRIRDEKGDVDYDLLTVTPMEHWEHLVNKPKTIIGRVKNWFSSRTLDVIRKGRLKMIDKAMKKFEDKDEKEAA